MKVKSIKVFSGILLLLSAIVSCNKPDIVTYKKEGNIYMPRAAGSSNLNLLVTDTAQSVIFGAAYGGLNYPSNDIAVSFKIDSSLINEYNTKNGTAYKMLPQASYQVSSLAAIINKGTTSSNSLSIKIITTNLNKGGKYIIPVSISGVSSGSIDSSLGTTFFTIDTIQRLEKDITSMAELSVSKENPNGQGAGEGSPKLVDGDYNSKFLTDGFPTPFWAQLKFPSARVVGAYTITSGNDAPDRDLKDWQLLGSSDGNTWIILDTRASEVFPGRNMTQRYEMTNKTAYNYYRLNVLANNGGGLMQVSEWRIINYP